MTLNELKNPYAIDKYLSRMCGDILDFKDLGYKHPITFIGIMKGGLFTTYSLLKKFDPICITIGHIGLSSYHNKLSSSEVKVTYPVDLEKKFINNRNVWIIDDVVDSGETLAVAKTIVRAYDPAYLHTAVLVDKKSNRVAHNVEAPNVVGFIYKKDEFLVGCGMGYGEDYRCLHGVYELVDVKEEL